MNSVIEAGTQCAWDGGKRSRERWLIERYTQPFRDSADDVGHNES